MQFRPKVSANRTQLCCVVIEQNEQNSIRYDTKVAKDFHENGINKTQNTAFSCYRTILVCRTYLTWFVHLAAKDISIDYKTRNYDGIVTPVYLFERG